MHIKRCQTMCKQRGRQHRRTCSSCARQSILSHWTGASRGWSSGPFTIRAAFTVTSATAGTTHWPPSRTGVVKLYPVIASNLPFGSGGRGHLASPAHLPTSARFRARAPGPVSGRLYAAASGGAGHLPRFPGAFRRPAFASWASCPAPGFRPSYDRPTAPPAGGADPSGVSMFRTRETRPGSGALCTPGTTAPTRPGTIPSRRLPPSSGRSLSPRHHNPPRDVQLTRHQQEFTGVHPRPAFPSPVAPGRIGDPWAFP